MPPSPSTTTKPKEKSPGPGIEIFKASFTHGSVWMELAVHRFHVGKRGFLN